MNCEIVSSPTGALSGTLAARSNTSVPVSVTSSSTRTKDASLIADRSEPTANMFFRSSNSAYVPAAVVLVKSPSRSSVMVTVEVLMPSNSKKSSGLTACPPWSMRSRIWSSTENTNAPVPEPSSLSCISTAMSIRHADRTRANAATTIIFRIIEPPDRGRQR